MFYLYKKKRKQKKTTYVKRKKGPYQKEPVNVAYHMIKSHNHLVSKLIYLNFLILCYFMLIKKKLKIKKKMNSKD